MSWETVTDVEEELCATVAVEDAPLTGCELATDCTQFG